MSTFDIPEIVAQLRSVRDQWREQQNRTDTEHREFPSRDAVTKAVEALKGVLFPLRLGPPDLRHAGEDFYVGHTLDSALHLLLEQARIELQYRQRNGGATRDSINAQADRAIHQFAHALPVFGSCWTPMCWPRFRAIPPRAAWMKWCSVTRACSR